MTPSEFIVSAKSQLRDATISIDPLLNIYREIESTNVEEERIALRSTARQYVEKFMDAFPKEETVERVSEFLQKDFCAQLIEHNRNKIPEPFLDLLDSEKAGCGLLEDERPYCLCVNFADDKFAILMSRGLVRLLYSIVRTFSKIINFGENENSDIKRSRQYHG